MAKVHAVHSVVQKQEADAAPSSSEQCAAGAMVQVEVQCVQVQAAEEPQGQQEHKRGELIEPCPAVSGQSPSGADISLQRTREWER